MFLYLQCKLITKGIVFLFINVYCCTCIDQINYDYARFPTCDQDPFFGNILKVISRKLCIRLNLR